MHVPALPPGLRSYQVGKLSGGTGFQRSSVVNVQFFTKTFYKRYQKRYYLQSIMRATNPSITTESLHQRADSTPTPSDRGGEVLRHIQAQARYLFGSDEFAKLTGRQPKSSALKMALYRLAKQGHIVLALKKPAKWLIVPPEHVHYGAPPVEWWIDDYLKDIEPDYYVALLSAARYWGSAHYALQTTQIMVGKPRSAIKLERIKVAFVAKKKLRATPTIRVRTGVASLRVSTREATLLDLIRHQAHIGGIEAVARIAKDFSGAITAKELTNALDALDQIPTAQRLGFVLDHLGLARPAMKVALWLAGKRRNIQSLELPAAPDSTSLLDERWGIQYHAMQRAIFEELT